MSLFGGYAPCKDLPSVVVRSECVDKFDHGCAACFGDFGAGPVEHPFVFHLCGKLTDAGCEFLELIVRARKV